MKTKRATKVIAFLLAVMMCLTMAPTSTVSAEGHVRGSGTRDFANVVLFAYFQDETEQNYFNEASPKDGSMTAAQNIMEYYNGSSGRSFTNYLDTISYGQFKVHNVFPQYDAESKNVEAIELPYSKASAQNGNIDYSVIKSICSQGIPEISETVDYDGDGAIDNVTIILVGSGSNTTQSIPTLYPHMDTYPGSDSLAGKQVSAYNMLNTDRMFSDESGLICHEFLHTLGYQDLYTKDGSLPVYNWDIMGQSSKYVAQPLAYSKMHFTGWVTLDTIDASQNGVTLDASFENGGKQAYIIKAPNNPYEVFVVERRTQGDRYNEDSLDAAIGGSGIIVYRVDTTVSGLSNYFGKNAVYIFRPQEGQNGFVTGSERQTLNNAYLSAESGRTSIGTSDLNKGLADGALTFSDGTNSGIVISNVSSSADSKMRFDISIPDASQYDLWEDTGFNQGINYKYTTLTEVEGQQIAAGYGERGSEIQLFVYENDKWVNYGNKYSDGNGVSNVQLFSMDGMTGVAYQDGNGVLRIAVCDGSNWRTVTDSTGIQNVSAFDVEESADGQNAHLVYIQGDENAFYSVISSDAVLDTAQYFSNGYIGNAQVLITEDAVYATVRDLNQSPERIRVYAYEETGNSFQEIQSPGEGSAYDMIAYNNELYFATGSTSSLLVRKYSGNQWSDYASLTTDSFTPKMAVAQGNLYILTVPAATGGKEGLRAYAVANGQITQEGSKIDNGGNKYSMTASADTLFVGYSYNNKAFIKKKTTVNSLLSLTIVPPDKTSYLVGDNVVYDGLKVYANYVNGHRELAWGEYSVTGFDAETPGEKTATVSFGGISNTFAYNVLQDVQPQPTEITSVTISDLEAPQGGQKPDTEATVQEAGVEIESITWNPAVTDGKFGYGEKYQAVILLKAEDGYTFSNAVKTNVTGTEKAETQITADGKLQITSSYATTTVPEITVSPDSMELKVGETKQIAVSDETGSKLEWRSENPDIASVEQDGSVTGVKAGNTTITVKNVYGKQAKCTVTVKDVELTGISLNKSELTVNKGESSEALSVIYEPDNATGDRTVTWTSSNEKVAVVKDGVVTGVSGGDAVITAKVGTHEAECKVSVVSRLNGIEIKPDKDTSKLEVGDKVNMTVTYAPADTTDSKKVEWKSLDENVATVDENGVVTAVGGGVTKIVATSEADSSIAAEYDVKVMIHTEEITLNTNVIELIEGEVSQPLAVTFYPGNTDDSRDVEWFSSDETVAKVDAAGRIRGVKQGTAVVTAKTVVGGFEAHCTVTVKSDEIHVDDAELPADLNPSVLYVGQSHDIKVTVTPANTTDDVTYAYKSSDNEILSVSEEGIVKALKEGTAEITITVTAGNFTKELIYKVDVKELPLNSIAFKQEVTPLEEGQTVQLEILFSSEEETVDKTVTWSSSDETVATVDETGLLTALKAGKTMISAKAAGKEISYELTVTEKETEEPGTTPPSTDDDTDENNQTPGTAPSTGNTNQNTQNGGKDSSANNSGTVQTGDTSNIFGVIALVVLSFLTAAGVVIIRNSRRKRTEKK